MKAKKKTNHLQEEADKIEHIPEKNNGHDGQDEPSKAKTPKKNRFLARLQKTWARITGCMRSCNTIQEERSAEELPTPNEINMEEVLRTSSGIIMEDELPTPSMIIIEEELPTPSGIIMDEELSRSIGINMEKELLEPSGTNMEEELPGASINMQDSKANCRLSSEVQEKEDDVEENQNIKTNNEEAEPVTDSFVEQAIQVEHQRLNDLIHSLEDLSVQYYAINLEILAEYNCINNQIQSLEDLYIQHYNAEDELNGEELESKAGDNEVKIKDVGDNGESIKDSQRASSEMPGLSHINSRDNESSKGKEKDDDKGENTSISINTEREKCRSEESSSKSSSLEEELHKSTNTSQSDSSHDEEPIPNNICMEKPKPGKETPATVPLKLQSFTFHQTLGEGSFGKVYLARDIIRKECVAIKVTNKLHFMDYGCSFVERNILELSHESPHLIHGLAAFHTEKCIYYVMELAARGDLRDFMLKHHPLDHPTIQFIISELICGTQFLHKKGIIHRDLKLGNILLSADGHVKITDFGIAAMDANERTKKRCVGTAKYMAPEMVRRQEHGEGVDYFAIGVILYKMYTSKFPFTGQNSNDVKLAILHNTPQYPEFLTPDTVNILLGLLHKDQHHRLGVEGDVRKHPYFSNINWEDVEARRVVPPAIMTAASVNQNRKRTLRYAEKWDKIRPEDQEIFKGFSFICPEWSHQYHPTDTIKTESWMAKLFSKRPFKKKTN